MKLVVGLGNPGKEYAGTRHNAGFMVVDELMRRCFTSTQSKFKGAYARGRVGQTEAVFLKPMTFMNNSGISVGLCASFFGIEPQDTVVIHDELDLDFGTLRVKRKGGHGGHNGLRSIFQHYDKGDFARVRFGIGRPQHGSPTKWVLTPFNADERITLEDIVGDAADAVDVLFSDGIDAAMNRFNQRPKGAKAEFE